MLPFFAAIFSTSLLPSITLSETANLVCHGQDLQFHRVKTMAKLNGGEVLQLKGKFEKVGASEEKYIFISDEMLEGEAARICNENLQRRFGKKFAVTHLKAAASFSSQTAEWSIDSSPLDEDLESEIRFEMNEDREKELESLIRGFDQSMFLRFLEKAHQQLSTEHPKNVLASTVNQYIHEHPEIRLQFESYLNSANRYENPPIQWNSSSKSEQIIEYIDQYQEVSDFTLLSFQMSGGARRGAYNSYTDLVTDAFKPVSEQGFLKTPGLYDDTRREHRLIYAWIKAFSAVASARGIQRALIKNSISSDLATLYDGYIRTLSKMEQAIGELEEIESEREDGVQIKSEALERGERESLSDSH